MTRIIFCTDLYLLIAHGFLLDAHGSHGPHGSCSRRGAHGGLNTGFFLNTNNPNDTNNFLHADFSLMLVCEVMGRAIERDIRGGRGALGEGWRNGCALLLEGWRR